MQVLWLDAESLECRSEEDDGKEVEREGLYSRAHGSLRIKGERRRRKTSHKKWIEVSYTSSSTRSRETGPAS